jgi:dsDNA-binding SOS-regulon protein
MFGWTEEDAPPITDAEHAMLDAADELTDRLVRPAYAVLDEGGRQALVNGMAHIQAALT